MNITEKIALANKIKNAVIGSHARLENELADYGSSELINDESFKEALRDRAVLCSECGIWCEPEQIDDLVCEECRSDDWDYE